MKRQTTGWLVATGVALALGAAVSPAQACRVVRPMSEAEVRERTALFTATVDSLDRAPEAEGQRIRAVLRAQRPIHGTPEGVVIVEDHVRSDGEIVVSCGGPLWPRDELIGLSAGDEVVVRTWRTEAGVGVVDLGRLGGAHARRLLDAAAP